MQCPRCQARNPEGVRLCGYCGARLELLCLNCGQPVSPRNFCRSCGAALTTESSRFTSDPAYTPKHLAE
ncbi:MAG: double zinc ribbon domain-containing protein [Candidatus Rokuibacteriota bacterium]